MSLILRVLDAAYCSSTHHKLALDALEHLSIRQADAWRDFLLTHHRVYFVGAKDPDKTFKDFRNHEFAKSAGNPKEGLDATGREVVSQMLAFATISLARHGPPPSRSDR